MTREILNKFINNHCTEEELEEVYRWIKYEALNEEFKNLGLKDWENYREEEKAWDEEKFSDLFDKIQLKIDLNRLQTENKKTKSITLPVVITWVTRAAAILLIPVLVFMYNTLNEKKKVTSQFTQLSVDSLEVNAPIGSRTVVQLSDGSEVHLNYGSKLKYPQVFGDDKREVKLSGEGYFIVAHNPQKPFIVNTGKVKIKALGTSFNVFAYPGNDHIETTLVNGKVVVEKTGITGTVGIIGEMIPGQHINYNVQTDRATSSFGSVEKYIAWTEGKMVFEDATTTFVAEKLSRMFDVEIEVMDNAKDFLYTVTFVDEPLFQILDLMTIATPVNYKIIPRKKLPDGTFTKLKIIIEKRQQ